MHGEAFLTPLEWGRTFSAPPIAEGDGPPGGSGLVRRWCGTSALMRQPPIDHDFVVLHLGGSKRVRREGDGEVLDQEVPEDSLTFVPAGSAFSWRTEGPIDFAHLYLRPEDIRATAAGACLIPAGALPAQVGVTDPLLSNVMKELLREAALGAYRDELYVGQLFDTFLGALTRRHLDGGKSRPYPAVSSRSLRSVLDYVEGHLGERLTLARLAGVAGLSPSHFTRVFRDHVGQTPAAYVERRRIERAKERLRTGKEPVGAIAESLGFRSHSHFSRRFLHLTGVTPLFVRSGRNRP